MNHQKNDLQDQDSADSPTAEHPLTGAAAAPPESELAKRSGDHDALLAEATYNRRLIAALQAAAAERTATLARLEIDLAAQRSATAELAAAKDTLERRIAELEEEIRARDKELSLGRAFAEQQSLLAEKLSADLEAKQTTLDLLQRNVERLTSLGANPADLDRQIAKTAGARAPKPTASTTVAPLGPASKPAELVPIAPFLIAKERRGANRKDAQPPRPSQGVRRLVGHVAGVEHAYSLTENEMTIGRAAESDIRIPSHFISRVHAKIVTRGGATTIEDFGSKNGIYVNSQRVERCVLCDGDIVSLATELELRFLEARR